MSPKTINLQINRERSKLYKTYCKGEYEQYNKNRIDYVIDHVYKKLIKRFNWNEELVLKRLSNKGIMAKTQLLIPIASEGGKLEHLYIADITVDNTIIEVDGPQHNPDKDLKRDELTASLGYTTIRIPTSDLSKETIDAYLQSL